MVPLVDSSWAPLEEPEEEADEEEEFREMRKQVPDVEQVFFSRKIEEKRKRYCFQKRRKFAEKLSLFLFFFFPIREKIQKRNHIFKSIR